MLVHLRYFILISYPHFHLPQQKEKRTKKEKVIYDDNNGYVLFHLITNLKGVMDLGAQQRKEFEVLFWGKYEYE